MTPGGSGLNGPAKQGANKKGAENLPLEGVIPYLTLILLGIGISH